MEPSAGGVAGLSGNVAVTPAGKRNAASVGGASKPP